MASLSSNLKKLIKKSGMTHVEIALLAGISQPTIHRLSRGINRNPKLANIKSIAACFKVSTSQLIGEMPLPDEESGAGKTPRYPYGRRIPIVDWQEVTNWPVVLPCSEIHTRDYLSIDLDVSRDACALVVNNQAMKPRLPQGTVLVADPERTPGDQDFVIVHFRGKSVACLRQIRMGQKGIYFNLLNTSLTHNVSQKATDEDRIIAVVAHSKFDFY